MNDKINHIIKILREGGIIAYPTEGVYGLGCDPFNETAVLRVLKIKQRHINKGLILIASNWNQVKNLINLDLKKYPVIKLNNKNPITWVFPATKKVPRWITGKFNSVAIRVTSHPIAKKICQKFGGPIVSTSANLTKQSPITRLGQMDRPLVSKIDFIAQGRVGKLKKPTNICDVKTGKVFRGQILIPPKPKITT